MAEPIGALLDGDEALWVPVLPEGLPAIDDGEVMHAPSLDVLTVPLPWVDDELMHAPTVEPMPGTEALAYIDSGIAFAPWVVPATPVVSPVTPPPPPTPGYPPPDLITGETVFDRDMEVTIAGEVIVLASAPQCQAQDSDLGSGEVQAWLAAGGAPAAIDDLMSFYVLGRAALTCRVATVVTTSIDPGEEATQLQKVTGVGWLDDWSKLCIYPDLGAEDPTRLDPPLQETRVFNYSASSGVDDTAWAHAVVTDPKYGQGALQRYPWPKGFQDSLASWIAPTSQASGAGGQGTWYARDVFNCPERVQCQVQVSAFDATEVYLDGILVLTIDPPGNGDMATGSIELGEHFHLLAFKVLATGSKRTGLLYSVLPFDGARFGTPLTRSGAQVKVLGFGQPPPKFSPGKVMRVLLEEGHTRGTLTDWGLGFNDLTDSAGQPWPQVQDISVPVGSSGLDVIRQFGDEFWTFRASATTKTLLAYVKEGFGGGFGGAAYGAGTLQGLVVTEATATASTGAT